MLSKYRSNADTEYTVLLSFNGECVEVVLHTGTKIFVEREEYRKKGGH